MRKLLFLLLLAFVFPMTAASQTCCSASGFAAERAMYASKGFAALHLAPLPFHYILEAGSYVSFPTTDGTPGRALLIKAPHASNKYLIVIHEWWGLNSYIEQEAERWQKDLGNVNVLALDLYDGQVASTPEEAQKLSSGVKSERLTAIIKGAIGYAGPKAKIATLGWCFGGGWALQTSLLAGSQTEATVMYYGMPELEQSKLKTLHGPVIEFFGSKDAYIGPDKKIAFTAAMKKARRSLETHTYNAVHAFANPSNPNYDKAASADAHKRALAFLRKNFVKS